MLHGKTLLSEGCCKLALDVCYDVVIVTEEIPTMKTVLMSNRSVQLQIKLSEIREGLSKYRGETYLCLVVKRIVSEEYGLGDGYYLDENRFARSHFFDVTDQMREQLAPYMGYIVDDWIGYSVVNSWARNTKYSMPNLMKNGSDSDIEYRDELLRVLIEEHGDVGLVFNLMIVEASPFHFGSKG